jgi:hypothetical protein
VSDLRINWLLVKDAVLIVGAVQVVLAAAAHYVGFVSRFLTPLVLLTTAAGIFWYGVSTNPSSALSAGVGGAIAGGTAVAAGMAVAGVLGDIKTGPALMTILGGTLVGVAVGIAGSAVGRKVFGA